MSRPYKTGKPLTAEEIKERDRAYARKYWHKNKNNPDLKKAQRDKAARYAQDMTDGYIRNQVSKYSDKSSSEVTDEEIQERRIHIQMLRDRKEWRAEHPDYTKDKYYWFCQRIEKYYKENGL